MYVYIDEDSQHKVATLFSGTLNDTHCQVEFSTGKRIKIKTNQILLTFSNPSPDVLITQATQEASLIDIDFLWELLPQSEFTAIEFAHEYFGGTPSTVSSVQQVALLMALHAHPALFNRKGKGIYKPVTPEMLSVIKESLAKKAKETAYCEVLVQSLIEGTLPSEIKDNAIALAFKPDKNSILWKALSLAADQLNTTPIRLLLNRQAFNSPYAYHQEKFYVDYFPQGVKHKPLSANDFNLELSLNTLKHVAKVEAFSIDDSSTTEIDDALSVTALNNGLGHTEVGIHIAAPSLAITKGSALDKIAKARMSTVYMPGEKITMLPDAIVAAFSLDEGKNCPALSLYATFNEQFELINTRSVVEYVPIVANLRTDYLEPLIDTVSIETDTLPDTVPFQHELKYLYALRKVLSAQRDAVRGKPENNNRINFNFAVDTLDDNIDTAIVSITQRPRGSPLDAIVSEMMIFANSHWAGYLEQLGMSGMFRGQRFGKVKMSTSALPHDSIGVPHYGWFTSPLRRYSDLINQAQILACIEHGNVAVLKAPYKPKEVDLYGLLSAFEEKYTAYRGHQDTMERYWCLRWLKRIQAENHTPLIEATVVREGVEGTVVLKDAPLYISIGNIPIDSKGQSVMIEIIRTDELELTVEARLIQNKADKTQTPLEEDVSV